MILEKNLERSPDDLQTRVKLAVTLFSKARFHDGGEAYFNRALTEGRRVLQHDPKHNLALIIAAGALTGLNRVEKARAGLLPVMESNPEQPEFQLVMGDLLAKEGQRCTRRCLKNLGSLSIRGFVAP